MNVCPIIHVMRLRSGWTDTNKGGGAPLGPSSTSAVRPTLSTPFLKGTLMLVVTYTYTCDICGKTQSCDRPDVFGADYGWISSGPEHHCLVCAAALDAAMKNARIAVRADRATATAA